MSTIKMKAKRIRNPKWTLSDAKNRTGVPYYIYVTEDGRAFINVWWSDYGETEQKYSVKITNVFHGEEYRYEIFPIEAKGLSNGQHGSRAKYLRPYKIRP